MRETGPQPSLPCHQEWEVMGWCEADFKTDLDYFYTKDEQINRGVVIQTHPAQRPKLLCVLMSRYLVVARVYWYQAPYSLLQPHSSCTPRQLLVVNMRTTQLVPPSSTLNLGLKGFAFPPLS